MKNQYRLRFYDDKEAPQPVRVQFVEARDEIELSEIACEACLPHETLITFEQVISPKPKNSN